jgi:poly-beta-1,6-N-acetyl-D-glucosamine synthase
MYWIPCILVLPYLFLLLRIWISLQRIKQVEHKPDTSVFISVIIPCRNEELHLPLLLEDISSQDYPQEFLEVIVVDDNSSDRTYFNAAAFIGIKNLLVIKNSGAGKKSAIRTGIKTSSGHLIITTDADCRVKEKWLKTIASFFGERNPDMLVCPVQFENRAGFFARFQELEFLSLQGITAGCVNAENATMANGANLAFTKEVYNIHADNMHHEIASGDDIFFLHSLKKMSGAKIMWLESNEAIVTASSSTSLRTYLQQRKRWISKATAYKDSFTILLAIVTFVTNILLIYLLAACLFNMIFLRILIAAFLLKAIPDFLILLNRSGKYGRRSLMNWFLPMEIIYPFYILIVTLFSLFTPAENLVNYPSRKGI